MINPINMFPTELIDSFIRGTNQQRIISLLLLWLHGWKALKAEPQQKQQNNKVTDRCCSTYFWMQIVEPTGRFSQVKSVHHYSPLYLRLTLSAARSYSLPLN